MSTNEPVLRMEGITKIFSGVTALADVPLALAPGEVHALVGENGAGKSTLIKIMTGAYTRDGGEMFLEGRPVDFRTPEDAQGAGVVAVYQEVNLLTYRTVAENIYLGREPRLVTKQPIGQLASLLLAVLVLLCFFLPWVEVNLSAASLSASGFHLAIGGNMGGLNISGLVSLLLIPLSLLVVILGLLVKKRFALNSREISILLVAVGTLNLVIMIYHYTSFSAQLNQNVFGIAIQNALAIRVGAFITLMSSLAIAITGLVSLFLNQSSQSTPDATPPKEIGIKTGLIDWKRMNTDAEALLKRLGLDIDPRAPLGSLNIALRQMVAIARGVSFDAKVVVLDEPTSSLTEHEVQILYDVIRRLKAEGTAVVYISHRFDELYTVCDRVTILRDGKFVATRPLAGLEKIDLVCLMLGKQREELRQGTTAFRHAGTAAGETPLLVAENLKRGRKLNDVTVEVARGEIVGMAGLLGSGRTETARAIFGADSVEAGEVRLEGKTIRRGSVNEAIDSGIAFLTEDRKAEGIIPELSVRENLTLAALPALSTLGVVSRARQAEIVDKFMKRLGIKAANADQKIRELSGGNQQKVLLARWLCKNPKFLILDEPTRGIDIGAKGEIQALVGELAESGLGVLMISSELEELVEGSSRVVVMRDGQRVGELRGADISQDNIIRAMAEGAGNEATAASTATTHVTDTRPHAATPPAEPPSEGA